MRVMTRSSWSLAGTGLGDWLRHQDVRRLWVGGLAQDEYAIRDRVESGAPIDALGVGAEWAAVSDAPSIDFAYKLAEYNGEPRIKASSNKSTWPGPKQVWRRMQGGFMVADRVAAADEPEPNDAEPLRSVSPADVSYPVAVSDKLEGRKQQLIQAYWSNRGND